MAKQTFTAGQVLTAAQVNGLQTNDFNQTVSTKTAAYTFVVGDRGTRVVLNDTTARTFTIDDAIFSAGDTIQVHNINTGVLTIAAGAGVTLNGADVLTVEQYQGGTIFFTSASSAIFFPTAKTVSAGGVVLISATTIGSGVTSVTVSSAFSSTYDNYLITISGGVASTSVDLSLQLGATTTGYYAGYNKVTYSTGSASASANNNAANFSAIGVGTTNSLHAYVNVLGPNLAKNTNINGGFGINLTGSTSSVFAGFLNDSTQYTAFTIDRSSGTLTGGTIRVYGYANS